MIGITNEKLAGIPSLIVCEIDKKDVALPTVIYFHGFTSAKEHNLTIAYLLAEIGYRVVLPDSELHGEREQDISTLKKQVSFWNIVLNNVKELDQLKQALEEKSLILDGRIGVAGTSMGGITTSAALTQYDWIKTAAILMGSPKITTFAKTLVSNFKKEAELPVADEEIEELYDELEKCDLSLHTEKLNQRPLLFWHGESDSVVPFEHSYTFYVDVKDNYKDKNVIRFIKEKNRDHKVSRAAILETVKWFKTYL